MAKGKTCIIYRNRERIYLKFNSMADAGRYLGVDPKYMRNAIKYNHYVKNWEATTDLDENWFIKNGFKETKKIEGGWANAKMVRVVPKKDPNKDLNDFVELLKQSNY